MVTGSTAANISPTLQTHTVEHDEQQDTDQDFDQNTHETDAGNVENNMFEDDSGGDISESSLLFPCPVHGCTKVYQQHSRLILHLDIGNHKFEPERQTMRDMALQSCKQKLEAIQTTPHMPEVHEALNEVAEQDCEQEVEPCIQKLKVGWALQEERECTRFNENQRGYLEEMFLDGVKTNKKVDPRNAANFFQKEKINEHPRFQVHEYLKWQQIASFFSRQYAKMKEQGAVRHKGSEQTDDNELENVGADEVRAAELEEQNNVVGTGDCDEDYMEDNVQYETVGEEIRRELQATECFEK